jgi:MFS family permease
LIAFAFSEGLFIALMALQAEITTPETRSSVIGIITTMTGLIGGLGPTFGAWLITLGGNPLPFIAAGAMGLLAIVAVTPIRVSTTQSSRTRDADAV